MRSFAYAVALAAPLVFAAAMSPATAQTAPSFTGPRVEGLIGWDRSQVSGSHDDGVLYGAAVGYDMAMRGGLVVGIDGEINDSTVKDCYGSETAADPRFCAKAGRDLYVGGRVGKIVNPRTLLYVKAGYTNGRYKVRESDGVSSVVAGRNLDGLRLGAGAEYAIGPNSFVKAEYRYSNYESGISRNQVVGGFGFRF